MLLPAKKVDAKKVENKQYFFFYICYLRLMINWDLILENLTDLVLDKLN